MEDSEIWDCSTELFPDVVDKTGNAFSCQNDMFTTSLRRPSETRSEGVKSYDSESSEIDIEEIESLVTKKFTEADNELISYLTGGKGLKADKPRHIVTTVKNNMQNKNGVKIFKIIKNIPPPTINTQSSVNQDNQTFRKVSLRTDMTSKNAPQEIVRENPPSPTDGMMSGDRSLSKSAIAARENREKKKKYISGLEITVKELQTENTSLKAKNTEFSELVESLHNEVKYLKSVIANQSTLSRLLQNIPGIPDVQYIPSGKGDTDRKRPSDSDVIEHSSPKKAKLSCDTTSDSKVEDAGICLHVKGNAVSLELCAACNTKSKTVSL